MAALRHVQMFVWRAVAASLAIGCVGALALGMRDALWGGVSDQPKALNSAAVTTPNKLAEAIGYGPERAEANAALAIETRGGSIETQSDDWGSQLRESKYFERLKRQPSPSWTERSTARPSGLTKIEPVSLPPAMRQPLSGGTGQPKASSGKSRDGDGDDDRGGNFSSGSTYRTMCVRLCDGFFWPVSFATKSDNFDKDTETCERSCGGTKQARLFVYKNPGAAVEDMEDTDGKPYKRLPTAFQFRASYNDSCKCRAHPWEEASRDLHQSFALEDKKKKGDKAAGVELEALRKKLQVQADAAKAEAKKAEQRAEIPAKGQKSRTSAKTEKTQKSSALEIPGVATVSDGAADHRRQMSRAGRPQTPIILATQPGHSISRMTPVIRTAKAEIQPRAVTVRYGTHPAYDMPITRLWSVRRDAELSERLFNAPKVMRR